MTKTYKISIIIIILIQLNSCEEIITDMELAYDEKIVVNAVLEADSAAKNIMITRTLPPLEEWDLSKAEISDAEAKIISDGVEYKLKYTSNSLYTVEGLTIKLGKVYKLEVRWNGKTVSATTTIPFPITIDSLYKTAYKEYYSDYSQQWVWNVSKYAVFKPNPKSVYIGVEVWDNISSFYSDYSDVAYRSSDTNEFGRIDAKIVTNYFLGDTSNVETNNDYYQIEAYDEPFYDYFQTRYQGDEMGVIFGIGGSNMKGNILGDGIGLFIGMAATRFEY